MIDELNELRVRIAGDMVECRTCRGLGKSTPMSWASPNDYGKACPDCKDTTGRVYRFRDALRQSCTSGPYHKRHFSTCQGRGWVPAEGFMPLLLAAMPDCFFEFLPQRSAQGVTTWICDIHDIERNTGAAEAGNSPEAALYRAVLAAVGKDA